MKFRLYKDLVAQKDKSITWIEAGEYNVVRIFDESRVLIELYSGINKERQLTIVPIHSGMLNNG